MKNRSRVINAIVILALPLVITSCKSNDNNKIYIDPYFESYSEGVRKLQDLTNYRLTLDIAGESYDYVYTDNYYYNGYLNTGYIKNNSEVYPFEIYGDVVYPLELMSGVSDFHSLVNGISSLDLTTLTFSDSGVGEITSNNGRRTFLEFVGIDETPLNVTDYSLALLNNNISSAFFSMSVQNGTDSYQIEVYFDEINDVSFDIVDNYIANGGTYYTITEDFATIRTLFSNSNFTNLIRDENNEIIGHEYFTKNYYVVTYDPDKVEYADLYMNAYYGANNETLKINAINTDGNSTIVNYPQNGIYICYVSYDRNINDYVIQPLFTRPYNSEITDITVGMNYPTTLSLFSHFNLFNYNEENEMYYTTAYDVGVDMYYKLAVDTMIEEGSVVEMVGCGFNYELNETDINKSTVNLYVFVNVNGNPLYAEFEFTNFNETVFEPLEELTTNWTYDFYL